MILSSCGTPSSCPVPKGSTYSSWCRSPSTPRSSQFFSRHEETWGQVTQCRANTDAIYLPFIVLTILRGQKKKVQLNFVVKGGGRILVFKRVSDSSKFWRFLLHIPTFSYQGDTTRGESDSPLSAGGKTTNLKLTYTRLAHKLPQHQSEAFTLCRPHPQAEHGSSSPTFPWGSFSSEFPRIVTPGRGHGEFCFELHAQPCWEHKCLAGCRWDQRCSASAEHKAGLGAFVDITAAFSQLALSTSTKIPQTTGDLPKVRQHVNASARIQNQTLWILVLFPWKGHDVQERG